MFKLLGLASGNGSTIESLLKSFKNSKIQFAGVISNQPQAKVIQIADKWNIPYYVILNNAVDWNNVFYGIVDKVKPDLIVCAGFLRKLEVREDYKNKIINIHPSLLPKYGGKGMYGLHVHTAVLENKEEVSGCTVHYVNNEYDKGDIISQMIVDVLPNDTPLTLMHRVQHNEKRLYPISIKMILRRRH